MTVTWQRALEAAAKRVSGLSAPLRSFDDGDARELRAVLRPAQPPGGRPVTALQAAIKSAQCWLLDLADGGPDLMANAHHKAVHEAQELADSPTLDELADVTICLVGTALAHGWTLSQWAESIERKVAVNRCRTWVQLRDGTWQHRDLRPGADR